MAKKVTDFEAFVGVAALFTKYGRVSDFPQVVRLMSRAFVELNERLCKMEGIQCRPR